MSEPDTLSPTAGGALPGLAVTSRADRTSAWLMVVVAAVAMVATLPGRTHGLGMITERLLGDASIGITRLEFGQINLWATLGGALACIGIGRLIDRIGVRFVLTAVLIALGIVTISMTQVHGWLPLFVMILLTRAFGQSALSVLSITLVGKWFARGVSWGMAAYSVLMSLGFIAAFLAGGKFAATDWRVFWGGLGGIVLALGPLAWLVTRDPPSDVPLTVAVNGTLRESDDDFTLAAALRTPAFWTFAIATSLFGLISSGISLFNQSILADKSFPASVYYDSLALGTGVGLLGQFATGWLASRWSTTKLTSVALVVLAAGLVWLTRVSTVVGVQIYVVFNALAGSAITVMFFMVWSKLYGRKHLGQIQGAAQMLTVLASAIGPLLFAISKDTAQSYDPMLWILAAATAGLAVVAWFTPLPVPRSAMIDGARSSP